jgi:hypothetical protein
MLSQTLGIEVPAKVARIRLLTKGNEWALSPAALPF